MRKNTIEKILSKCTVDVNGCLIYSGRAFTGTDKWKYPVIVFEGKTWIASRLIWTKLVHHIPKGLYILHRCDNTLCVNVDHLFLGTLSDNIKDCVAKKRHVQARKTHCPQGHSYDELNTYLHLKSNTRYCKTCVRVGNKKHRNIIKNAANIS